MHKAIKMTLGLMAWLLLSANAFGVTWYVSTGGSGTACTIGSPCLTINQAYQNASGGDVIELATGTYGDQAIQSKTPVSTIFVQPAAAATVILSDLNINGAKRMEFRLNTGTAFITRAFEQQLNSQFITLRGVKINVNSGSDWGLGISGGDDFTMIGGELCCLQNFHPQIAPVNGWQGQGNRFTFDGVWFHDVHRTSDAQHVECLQVAGTTDMIIRNSKFGPNCDVFDLSFTEYNSSGKVINLTLENNWFDGSTSGGFYAVNISQFTGGIARYNSSSQTWVIQGTNPAPMAVEANNIFGGVLSGNTGVCVGSNEVVYKYNVTQNQQCGPTDKNAAPGFVNQSGFDQHLTAASGAIDYVNSIAGTTISGISTDIDGNARPVGPRYDAGASEFGGSGGGGDITPPSVALTAPASGATVSGASVTLSATCTDNINVASVQFKIDNADVGSLDTSSPYSVSWDSTTVGNGAHQVTALCTDTAANSAQTGNTPITVTNAGGGSRTAPTFGTPRGNRTTVNGTTIALTAFSLSANSSIACWVDMDDNTSDNSTTVSGIAITGSPTYAIAWARKSRQPYTSAGVHIFELWTAQITSAVSSQTLTATLAPTTRAGINCFPSTGGDAANPYPTVAVALGTGVTVPNSARDNSHYLAGLGCGDNASRTVTAGTGFTLSGVEQGFGVANGWVHVAVERTNSAVASPTNTATSFTSACTFPITIGLEVAGALTSVSAPATPTGLAGTAGNAQISWSWNTVATAASYTLSVGPSGGPYVDVFTGATTSFLQTGLTNAVQRCAKVLATNAGGSSALSSEVCATPTDPTPVPTAPTNLQATAGNSQVILNWTASGNTPTGYKVYRDTTTNPTTLLATIGNVVTYTDSTAVNSTLYYYRVKGSNGTGDSSYSNEVSATPTSCLIGNDLIPVSYTAFSTQTGYMSITWQDILSTRSTGAISGISDNQIASFNEMAAAVRFGASGFIEAQNGSTWVALNQIPWLINTTYTFRLFVDISNHKYNAYVTTPGGNEVIVGQSLAFNPLQVAVTELDTFNVSRDLHQVCSVITVTSSVAARGGPKAGSAGSAGTSR